jgi:hypothetical protein
MNIRNWVYLVASWGALLLMGAHGWMRPYAVTACGFLVSIALLTGGAKTKGD